MFSRISRRGSTGNSIIFCVLLLTATVHTVHANPFAARAAAALTDQVMRSIQPQIAGLVANAPVPPAAKAEMERQLTDAARRIVQTNIQGAMGGRLPNPQQLAQQVLGELRGIAANLINAAAGGVAATSGAHHAGHGGAAHHQVPQAPREKPRLVIRPFSGAGDDGATITALFSIQTNLSAAFDIVSDAANANFALWGSVHSLGDRNLLATAVIDIRNGMFLSGGYRLYRGIEEIPNAIPSIAQIMAASAERAGARLPSLIIAPFNAAEHEEETDEKRSAALSQMFSIAMANTGKYRVVPFSRRRSEIMRSELDMLALENPNHTAEDRAKRIGAVSDVNAEHVLFVETRTLGNLNMLIMQIHNVNNGNRIAGESLNFSSFEDAATQFSEVAARLASSAPSPTAPVAAQAAPPARPITIQQPAPQFSQEDLRRATRHISETERQAAQAEWERRRRNSRIASTIGIIGAATIAAIIVAPFVN